MILYSDDIDYRGCDLLVTSGLFDHISHRASPETVWLVHLDDPLPDSAKCLLILWSFWGANT